MSGESLRVGGCSESVRQAVQWVREYFDAEANRAAAAVPKGRPYAFPAYDRMETGSGPNELNDGDLLASVLLHVTPKLHAFLNLQAVRTDLEAVLAAIPQRLTLQDAVASGGHAEPLRRIGGLLDHPALLRGVGGTTLMKIMHRKRPLLLPLYDSQIYACYCGPGFPYPIQHSSRRTWARFLPLLGESMAHDLDDQPDTWKALKECAPDDVSTLRVLDVVAWNLGRGGRPKQ
ncbi:MULTISPECIES: DUF6308 family protein [unclassified Streptomyces]|uniref:DUF6308 family protein n=1 Tax=unclassified Streptomyces TaxID=2593676 RepID=UPI000377B8F9|nr:MULTISPECIES: DUF6308 family protein [unclassified Streptomyces]MYQ77596.1 hypothetical protein [Streptomyces sp. SID4923]